MLGDQRGARRRALRRAVRTLQHANFHRSLQLLHCGGAPAAMMEAPPDSDISSRTWLVSHGACVQLAVLFLLSLGRSDPYVVAPLVVLYAVRERDRKAMLLFSTWQMFTGAGCRGRRC